MPLVTLNVPKTETYKLPWGRYIDSPLCLRMNAGTSKSSGSTSPSIDMLCLTASSVDASRGTEGVATSRNDVELDVDIIDSVCGRDAGADFAAVGVGTAVGVDGMKAPATRSCWIAAAAAVTDRSRVCGARTAMPF